MSPVYNTYTILRDQTVLQGSYLSGNAATFNSLKYSANFSRRPCLRSYVPVYVLPHPECNTDNNALSLLLKFHMTICIRVLL